MPHAALEVLDLAKAKALMGTGVDEIDVSLVCAAAQAGAFNSNDPARLCCRACASGRVLLLMCVYVCRCTLVFACRGAFEFICVRCLPL